MTRYAMDNTEASFRSELIDTALRITAINCGNMVDLPLLWQAFLYIAHKGNEDARKALLYFFGDKDWTGCFPERIEASSTGQIPFDNDVNRLIGPLGHWTKKGSDALNPHTFITAITEIGFISKLGLPEVQKVEFSEIAEKNSIGMSEEASASTRTSPPKKVLHDSNSVSGIIDRASSKDTKGFSNAFKELQQSLETSVFGQSSAIQAFLTGLRAALERKVTEGKLGGSFLVFGPNGCGKGEMIRILEKWVLKYKRILRTKQIIYCEGYLPSVLPTLRSRIRSSEPSIIVLSEFEKYDSFLRDVLMEGMDRAVLQLPDKHTGGKLIATDIKGSLIILIGNVGRTFWGRLPFKETEMLPDRERIKTALEEESIEDQHLKSDIASKRLNRSFLDRIDYFIPFCQLRYADVSRVLDREIESFQNEVKMREVDLEVEKNVRYLIVLSSYYKRGWSARQALRGFKEHVEGPVRRIIQSSGLSKIRLLCSDKVFNRTMRLSAPRILLVDDEWESVKKDFDQALSGKAEVVGVSDITQAISHAAKEPFDLLLLDLYFNKEPLWKEYLSDWRTAQSDTPVLLLSGQFVSSADRIEIDRMGGVLGFIEKSADTKRLKGALDSFLEHAFWQARIRSFESQYGFGGDRVVFDNVIRDDGDALTCRFMEVQSIVSDGTDAVIEEPILPTETRREVDEFLDLFLDARKRARLKIKQPKGLLLCGPPGNGKTMLARNIAQRMRCNFIALTAGDFQSKYAGVAGEKIKEVFEHARMRQPCVVFIDEIDALAPKRSDGNSGLLRDQASTVAVLLTELDGFSRGHEIFLVGATNRKSAMDDALLRPGRLDRVIQVLHPAIKERKTLLKRAFAEMKSQNIDLEWASLETYDLSCAEIIRVVHDSVLLALRRCKENGIFVEENCIEIQKIDLQEAIDRLRYGVKPGEGSSEANFDSGSREIRAWHEAGHLIANIVLLKEIPERATIVMRGDFGGFVRHSKDGFMQRRAAYSRKICLAEIGAMLAGGVAERIKFGEHSAGVASDRKKALQLVRAMVVDWGMDSAQAEIEGFLTGINSLSSGYHAIEITNSASQKAVVEAMAKLMKEGTELATNTLEKSKDELERAANLLLETEELDHAAIEKEFGRLLDG